MIPPQHPSKAALYQATREEALQGGRREGLERQYARGNVNMAWLSAEIAVMGPKGAVEILRKRNIQSAEAPEALTDKLGQEYREKFANPYIAAERSFIDDMILPSHTRPHLLDALSMSETKVDTNPRKKHGNIPL